MKGSSFFFFFVYFDTWFINIKIMLLLMYESKANRIIKKRGKICKNAPYITSKQSK